MAPRLTFRIRAGYLSPVRLLRPAIVLALASCAAELAFAAGTVDGAWFVRHVAVPALYLPFESWVPSATRLGLALAAVLVAGLAALCAWSKAGAGDLARIALAVLLALGAAELLLRRGESGMPFWRARKLELRMGHTDPRTGYGLTPSTSVRIGVPGATPVRYEIDGWGDRAARPDSVPDPGRPSLVVAGESIAVGHGLPFEQTFAAVLAGRLGLQLVNVGVGGYATDQAFLRLEEALGKLRQPKVVVMVFLPLQLRRNVQDYRPRMALQGGVLAEVPARGGFFAGLRLRDLVVNELPFLGEARLLESLAVTAAVLRESARRARERGARVLFLVPLIGKERPFDTHPEAQVLRPLFVEQGLPFVLVDIEPRELVPYDGHPDAAASLRIVERLDRALQDDLPPPVAGDGKSR